MSERKTVMTWTLTDGAIEFGVSAETLKRGLRTLNDASGPTFTTRQIHAALSGDFKAARAKKLTAEASMAELELAEEQKALVRMDEVEKLLSEQVIVPLRSKLLSLPTEMEARVNPADPAHARRELTAWRDDVLKVMRENLI